MKRRLRWILLGAAVLVMATLNSRYSGDTAGPDWTAEREPMQTEPSGGISLRLPPAPTDRQSPGASIAPSPNSNGKRTSPLTSELLEDPLLAAGSPTELQEDPQALASLIDEIVISRDEDRRVLAVSVLGFMRPTPEIVQTVHLALEDPAEAVRTEAVLAIASLTGSDAGTDLRRIEKEDPSAEVRQTAARSLKELSDRAGSTNQPAKN